ncbi:hypothetical protein C8A03DRAFT_37584 [Achaetomium macrosporum]|uniref:Glyoxalase/fosfomycin resistance/dioxygenase domain-containing protein n=1 Tax=Achaetomium macrosporum TaxID=79813 RepID=A0AAN7C3Z5_9PEZI|nr:hypothetical protein C8A03DRAFT_37584 [Achaetomium macrosporum]
MPYLAHVSLLVQDYDEAIAFYSRLGFEVVEDTVIPEQQKRWVTIRTPPPHERAEQESRSSSARASPQGATILLARPSNADQEMFVGN